MIRFSTENGLARFALALLLLLSSANTAFGQHLERGGHYWYVPEHEQSGRTTFYAQPNFNSGFVRVPRAQRFKLIQGVKGWAMIQFDVSGTAYIHFRVLNLLVHNASAEDPWYEFKRASVFIEDPKVVEERLKATKSTDSASTDNKSPVWKRYKDNWGLKPARPTPSSADADRPEAPTPSTSKPKSKHPLLPPIGKDVQEPDAAAAEDERPADALDPVR